ncbi:MAG TPA: hypothetical protein VFA27_10765 [Vicinamibacterales bacterium]|nr:hypothetical protein [Vicinamibacterales bacterium]
MIASVSWQYIVLNGSATVGYRVKRRTGGSVPPVYQSGTDTPLTDNWVSQPAPAQISYGGANYVLGFWSLTSQDSSSTQRSAQIQTGAVANDSHSGGVWTVTAKAYYIPDLSGGGVGGNGGFVLIDAFDIQLGDFIGDDFVDVHPDPAGTRTTDANNGFLDTNALPQGNAVTIAARDALPQKQFAYWLAPLVRSSDANAPATVGTTEKHEIVVHHDDLVIAFSFYNETQQPTFVPPWEAAYDWLWWWKTRGGLVPPVPPWGPGDPWMQQVLGALSVGAAAHQVGGGVRRRVLEAALEQIALAANALKQQINSLEKE